MAFSAEQVKKALDSKANRASIADVRRIAELREAVTQKLVEFPPELGVAREQGALLFAFLEASTSAALTPETQQAAGALLYLSAPVDLVPDHEPGGYEDDAAVLALAIERIGEALRLFCEQSGYAIPGWIPR